jgi:hypothetical protein
MPIWYLKSFYMTKSLCDGVDNKNSICGVCKQCVYNKSGFVQKCVLCFNLFHDSCRVTSTSQERPCPLGMKRCPCAIYLHVGDIPLTTTDDNSALLPITMATPHHGIQGTIVTKKENDPQCTLLQHGSRYVFFTNIIDILLIVYRWPTLELENYLPAKVTL